MNDEDNAATKLNVNALEGAFVTESNVDQDLEEMGSVVNTDQIAQNKVLEDDGNVESDIREASSALHTDIQDMGSTPSEENADAKNSSCTEKSDVVELWATAVFENSPYDQLSQEEFQSLGRFVTSSDHLARNIVRVIIDRNDSRCAENGRFVHSAQVRIQVRTDRLWESPRSYVWKHLGQDVWDRSNGTRITLRQIHQKN